LQNNLLGTSTAGGSNAFQRVNIDFLSLGGARVTWTLDRHFKDPDCQSWLYTLQASYHGPLNTFTTEASVRTDDWEDVGTAQEDVNELVDETRRAFGKALLVSYRVVLETSVGIYFSPPAVSLGSLDKRDWLKAREIARRELLLHKKATSQDGYLLRRKRRGDPCTKCLDESTGDVTLSKCDVCRGTRIVHGYFAAIPSTFCQVAPTRAREHREMDKGPVREVVTQGRILAVPGLVSGDAWVDATSDRRYYIHVVGSLANVRGVPVVLQVELRLVPYDDAIYHVELIEP
jgi:hypothetical protein